MLEGKLSEMKEVTVGEYVSREKQNFVDLLKIVLPPSKQQYANLIAAASPDEFLITVKTRLVPKKKDLDGVLYFILSSYGVDKLELGGPQKDPAMAERRFQVIKKYLGCFCALAERILKEEAKQPTSQPAFNQGTKRSREADKGQPAQKKVKVEREEVFEIP